MRYDVHVPEQKTVLFIGRFQIYMYEVFTKSNV